MNPSARMNLETLVERARQGDTDAWSTLYQAYAGPMKGVCIRLLGRRDEAAEDLVHDAFLLAFADIGKLRNPQRFGQWLTSIVTHLTLQHLERRRRHPSLPLADLPPDLLSSFYETTDPAPLPTGDELMKLVEELPEGYRQVFRMAVIEKLPHAEIARRLGIAPHSSSSQLHRAKALLRKLLARRQAGIIVLAAAWMWPWGSWLTDPSGYQFHPWSCPPSLPATSGHLPASAPVARATGSSRPAPPATSGRAPLPQAPMPHYRHGGNTAPDTLLPAPQPAAPLPQAPMAAASRPDSHMPAGPDLRNAPTESLAESKLHSGRQKWKLLLSGAAGPALAQSLNKLITTEKGDIGSGMVPATISTWEEYYDYLLTRSHDNMPADSLTLLHIAQNNSGRLVEQAHHSRPLTFGLSFSKRLSPHWRAETGLQYSLLKSTFTIGSGCNLIQEQQRVYYLSVPLKFSYTWPLRKHWETYVSAGAALHIPLGGKVKKVVLTDTVAIPLDHYRVRPAWQGSISTGVGLQYHFTPNLGLYIEPTLQYYLPTGSSTRTVWTEHPLTFSLPLGLRLTW